MVDERKLQKIVGLFKEEANEHIASINQKLLDIERTPEAEQSSEILEAIFRDAHSLKGAARTAGFVQIETISHHMESVFGQVREGNLKLDVATCDVLYGALDVIEQTLTQSAGITEIPPPTGKVLRALSEILGEDLAPPLPTGVVQDEATEQAQPSASNTESSATDETIRVSIQKLESLMAQASELLVFKITTEQRLADLRHLKNTVRRYRKIWRGYTEQGGGLKRNGNLDHELLEELLLMNRALFGELPELISDLEHGMANDTLRLGMVVDNVQDDIRQARMLPFKTILGGFRRMVRDLANQQEKEIYLDVSGDDIEIDKKILEEVRDPIMHLLSNAIAHGIEPPAQRQAAGKGTQGLLKLHFLQKSNFVTIIIEDDGDGIDLEALRDAAVRKGVLAAEDAQTLSEQEITQLALISGLSTTHMITNLAGRGVGLDIVRHTLEKLQGTVSIQTTRGQGTCFELTVPLTLSTTHGLFVKAMHETYAIPISVISKIVTFRPQDIRQVNGRQTIQINEQAVALVQLATLVDLTPPPLDPQQVIKAVILQSGDIQIAFIVEDLVGEQEMVIKGLGQQLKRVSNLIGATLMGTGDVVMILNAVELMRKAQGTPTRISLPVASAAADNAPLQTILVVDDSITTRTLEKNVLEAAGYKVVTAIDGLEAWRYLQNNPCDLVVSDVQMPQMNGFELTETVKTSSQLGHLPVILVTSLESREDKERGLVAGADAYIVKKGFAQEDLLETIRQLL